MAWADVQSMTLRQAEFVAAAGQVDEDEEAAEAVDHQIALLRKVADRDGLSLYDFGRLGAGAMAERAAAFSGTQITAAHILPLLNEPEFTAQCLPSTSTPT